MLSDTCIDQWVTGNRAMLIDFVRELVTVPSENHPPHGNEREAQLTLQRFLTSRGLSAELYDITDVAGVDNHPLRHPAVDCRNRPNVVVRRPGTGHGRSLLLSGHMDVVPAGDHADWSHPPYGGHIDGNRLYGRGTYDMKAGVAANFAVLMMLEELGVELPGDLIVESVADEEFAGGHGSIAGRLKGDMADAAIIPEPSNLAVYRAHRGLRIAQLTITGSGGVTFSGERPEPAVHQLPALLNALTQFADERNAALRVPECYAHETSPANWMITKIRANEWAQDALLAVPATVDIEFFWETLPGETQADVEGQFERWLDAFRVETGIAVSHCYSLRWMEGYETTASHPLVTLAERHVTTVTGETSLAIGAPFPCDLFLFKKLGIPAGIIVGPKGANAHAPDEWVDLDSYLQLIRILARTVCDWCQPQ